MNLTERDRQFSIIEKKKFCVCLENANSNISFDCSYVLRPTGGSRAGGNFRRYR